MSSQNPDTLGALPDPVMADPPPRSGAVTAVAIVNCIFGCLNLVCGGMFVFGGGVLATFINTAAQQDPNINAADATVAAGVVGGLVVVMGVVIMILSLPMLIAGYGVAKRAGWGRILTIILGFMSIVFAVIELVQFNVCGLVFHAGYAIFVLVILFNSRYAAEFA